jgi:hypothetical protein
MNEPAGSSWLVVVGMPLLPWLSQQLSVCSIWPVAGSDEPKAWQQGRPDGGGRHVAHHDHLATTLAGAATLARTARVAATASLYLQAESPWIDDGDVMGLGGTSSGSSPQAARYSVGLVLG